MIRSSVVSTRASFPSLGWTIVVIGAPLGLALLELFHPRVHDPTHLTQQQLQTWLRVHYLQIALFPLAALSLGWLIRGLGGGVAMVARIALLVFAVTYVAFDTAAGVVSGVLVQAAQEAGGLEAWQAPILAIWTHPIIGGMGAPLLAALGSVAWLVGALAAALALRRDGASWGVAALLVISALGLSVFRTHAWPGGPLTFGALGLAAAWQWWDRTGGMR